MIRKRGKRRTNHTDTNAGGQDLGPCLFPLASPAPSRGLAQKRKQYLFAERKKTKSEKRKYIKQRERGSKVEEGGEMLVSCYPKVEKKVSQIKFHQEGERGHGNGYVSQERFTELWGDQPPTHLAPGIGAAGAPAHQS